jgi:hypothetical protein
VLCSSFNCSSAQGLKQLLARFVLGTQMARIRSTGRVTGEGGEIEATETAPISKIMRDSGMVIQEGEESVPEKGIIDVEAKTVDVEADSHDEEDGGILSPRKPSHIEFRKSIMKLEDLILMKKLDYFVNNDDELIRFAGDEIVPESKNDEVIVFKSFFRAGLRFPLYEMISEVLKKFEIYLH